jgi:lipoprotein-releasing system ATP-binding protein
MGMFMPSDQRIKTMLLELKNVSKQYSSPDGVTDVPYILKDVALQVNSGETVAITGPSGSGKSTLLNIIGALDKPTSGQVFLDGRDISKLHDKELTTVRNRQIGFVFQLHHLLPQCTVLENVLIPTLPDADRSRKGEAEIRAKYLLERIGLKDRFYYRPGRLSGGERQRVAVVRALINNPKLLLADEPTGSLDHATANDLADLLVELNREEGIAIILVTHSLELAQRMSQILDLKDGALTQHKQ